MSRMGGRVPKATRAVADRMRRKSVLVIRHGVVGPTAGRWAVEVRIIAGFAGRGLSAGQSRPGVAVGVTGAPKARALGTTCRSAGFRLLLDKTRPESNSAPGAHRNSPSWLPLGPTARTRIGRYVLCPVPRISPTSLTRPWSLMYVKHPHAPPRRPTCDKYCQLIGNL